MLPRLNYLPLRGLRVFPLGSLLRPFTSERLMLLFCLGCYRSLEIPPPPLHSHSCHLFSLFQFLSHRRPVGHHSFPFLIAHRALRSLLGLVLSSGAFRFVVLQIDFQFSLRDMARQGASSVPTRLPFLHDCSSWLPVGVSILSRLGGFFGVSFVFLRKECLRSHVH